MEKQTHLVVHTSVFEADAGGGNPAPVVLSATHLSKEQMRQVAAAFGAETAFVLDPVQQDADVQFRFFVPMKPLAFIRSHCTRGLAPCKLKRGSFPSELATTKIQQLVQPPAH